MSPETTYEVDLENVCVVYRRLYFVLFLVSLEESEGVHTKRCCGKKLTEKCLNNLI